MIEIVYDRPKDFEIETIVKWLNDKITMKYSEQRHKKHTVDTQTSFIFNAAYTGKPDLYGLVWADESFIGTVTSYHDINNSVADVGILVGPEYSGKGYGTRVWGMFCAELAKGGIRKIEAGCMAKNKAMIRIFEKNGMRLEGTRKYHFQTGKDQYDDMVLYGMLT